jgi:hypothetical protein
MSLVAAWDRNNPNAPGIHSPNPGGTPTLAVPTFNDQLLGFDAPTGSRIMIRTGDYHTFRTVRAIDGMALSHHTTQASAQARADAMATGNEA